MKVLAHGEIYDNLSFEDFSLKVENSLKYELKLEELIICLDQFSKGLADLEISDEIKKEVVKFCSKEELEKKVISELGSIDAFDIKKNDFKSRPMEAYYPLGVALHVTPANSPGLAFLALVESLLGLNSNIVKLSRRDGDDCFVLAQKLIACDQTEVLLKKIFIIQDAPYEIEKLSELSDVVSCWGGDAAIDTIRKSVPASKRFIPWGHKISFSLMDLESAKREGLKKLARDIFQYDQLACSAPQVCYVLDAEFDELLSIAKDLAVELEVLSKDKPLGELDIQEQAELTNFNQLLKLESLIENKQVVESPTNDWRIYIEEDETFKASPLKRTIWLKPITVESILPTLKHHRIHLQTVGIDLNSNEFQVINELLKAGMLRVRNLGDMQNSYAGEPHDGELALSRFVKKISIDLTGLEDHFRLNELSQKSQVVERTAQVMSKEDFQALTPNEELAHLFFRSGGSSGKTAISPFSYNAYHRQMQAAAEGLFAAGLDPLVDKVANLFFGGGLYGGFLSFYTILEKLEIVQYPIAAYEDKNFVAEVLASNDINVIVGMPSYIIELFSNHAEVLKKSKVEKIYFGGEHFGQKQRDWLVQEFGIQIIRSASYGSVDAGPLGFQCPSCVKGEHHLNESIQDLEILRIDSDEKVSGDEIGRLVFTSKARDCVKIERYDLGDLGRWVLENCDCGRTNRKFELLGRHGDIFRAGGTFFNYMKFQKVLLDHFDYADLIQIKISNESSQSNIDRLSLYLTTDLIEKSKLMNVFQDLNEAVTRELTLDFEIIVSNVESFVHSKNSGKILRVIDERKL
ncbi:hypothetical protein A9Q84_03880 [Halobacteriovorax marinus]|uniref:Long-chain-fatty-acyl-CoA reductase n=1 Tax=Halobacteriovorax marinus TaxID=97084 RepID=A0A1Y5FFS5_9BACT|nr:hypothetical protein A9Q84_03880 [Halobacteriovorax marinus]